MRTRQSSLPAPSDADPPPARSHRGRRLLAASIAAGCALSGGGTAWAGTTATAGAGAGDAARTFGTGVTGARRTPAATITLVTGDRVRVSTRPDGTQDAALIPDSSDPFPGAYISRQGEHLYVVPLEAVPYLRAGKLDRALFDITAQVAQGMTDERAKTLKLMVSSPSSPLTTAKPDEAATSAASTARAAGISRASGAEAEGSAPTPPSDSTATVQVPSLGLTGVKVDKKRARSFWQGIDTAIGSGTKAPSLGAGVGKLWLDRKVKASLDKSVGQIGAPAAHAAGLDGTGITVAVLDTGIDNENEDVAAKVTGEKNFTAEDSTDDLVGHGTHVASIVAGSGAASGGIYKGVAPGAKLLDGRVLDSSGSGDDSTVLAGMEWAAQQGAQVINMSLGGGPTDGTDPIALAVNQLTATYGSLFVIAAGNSGAEETVSTPGSADAALTVGAVDRSDVLADFSSRGPRRGDGAIKPEITAPGVDIVAAQADGTQLGPVVQKGYVALSGTSMATPHVAGSAALLKQQHPGWTPAQLKANLVSTAKPTDGTPVWHQGVGRVDVAAATGTGGLSVDQGTVNLGFNAWPHGDDPVQTRTLAYTNSGSAATTLSLAAAFTGDQGQALPDGAVSISPTTLPLAAGESGTVTVTVDPNKAGVGRWGGHLTATATGGTALRTAALFTNESERYDVTVNLLDRKGKPTTNGNITMVNIETGEWRSSWDLADPTKPVFRMGPGTWFAMGMIIPDETAAAIETTVAVLPEVKVTGAQTITLDGSRARRLALRVPDRDVASQLSQFSVTRTDETGSFGTGSGMAASGEMAFYVTPTAKVSTGKLILGTSDSLRVPAITATVTSPRTTLHPQLLWSDDRLDGTRTLPVVDASGAVKGKLALLGVSATGPIDDELTRLAKAGAAAVAVYPATADADFLLDKRPPVPGVHLSPTEGRALAALLAKGTARVTLAGAFYSPKVYDLAHEWTGRIPARAVVEYGTNDLAQFTETYRDSGGHAPVSEVVMPMLTGGAWAAFLPARPGSTRTAYVSTTLPVTQSLLYGEVVTPDGNTPMLEWDGDPATYRPGRRSAVTWAPQVAKPGQGSNGYDLSRRFGDDVFAYLSPWTDGQGRISYPRGVDNGVWKLSADGSTIAEGTGPNVETTLPAKRQTYTLDFTDSIDHPHWTRSTRTTSRWTFRSGHVEPEAGQPLPLLGVVVPLPLDDTNSAKAGSTLTFEVTGLLPSSLGATKLSSLSVGTSMDGKRWTSAKVSRVDAGTFRVTISNPRRTGPVSLKVAAQAQDGASLTQEVTAAYVLK